jgi:hypothetical protein
VGSKFIEIKTMKTHTDPTWWTPKHDSAWERVKAAFRRDWDQTRHDFGGRNPDTDQGADNTVRQAAGKEQIPPRGARVYEDYEPAYRFGVGARSQYQRDYPTWTDDLESRLKKDWGDPTDWNENLPYVRKGWEYRN